MAKLLIAGLGSIGRRHLRNAVALGEGDIVLLRSHRSTLPDGELAGFPVESDMATALRTHRPDAVIVSNPTSLHLDVALPAARAGCAILMEKPPSVSLEGLQNLQDTASKSGAPILIGFQLRYHPHLIRARELLRSGRIGRVMSARVHFGEYLPAWHPWEDYRQGYAARADLGGGVLLTQCHSLDYLPWLVGRVKSLWASMARVSDLEIDVEDTVELGLCFESGALGSLHMDFVQRPPSHRLEISGTAGSLTCDLLSGHLRVYKTATEDWEEHALPPEWERNTMFMEEMRHFLAVIRNQAKPACNLDAAIRVMRLIAAAQESHRSGCLINLQS